MTINFTRLRLTLVIGFPLRLVITNFGHLYLFDDLTVISSLTVPGQVLSRILSPGDHFNPQFNTLMLPILSIYADSFHQTILELCCVRYMCIGTYKNVIM